MKILKVVQQRAALIAVLGLLAPLLGGCPGQVIPGVESSITPDVSTDFADRIDPGVQGIACFHRALAADGAWDDEAPYGDVWVPRVAATWRPYTAGHWLNTDAGWAWAGDEPWGWAVYHYGRWLYDAQSRWVWVPGTRWAPAWVAWRSGGGYLGWAPLPPAVGFVDGAGLTAGTAEISATHFWFVPETSLLAADLAASFVAGGLGAAIFARTTDITRYTVVNDRIVNVGISAQHIAEVTGRPVPLHSIASLTAGAGSTRGVFYQPAAIARGSGAVHAEFGRALRAQVAAEKRVASAPLRGGAAAGNRPAPGQARAAAAYRGASATRAATGGGRSSAFGGGGLASRSVAQGARPTGGARSESQSQAFSRSFGSPGTHSNAGTTASRGAAPGTGQPTSSYRRGLQSPTQAQRGLQSQTQAQRGLQSQSAYQRGGQPAAQNQHGPQAQSPYQRGGQPLGQNQRGLQAQSQSAYQRGIQPSARNQRAAPGSTQVPRGSPTGARPQMQSRPAAAAQGVRRRPPV
jgi:hypothetical protein